MKQSAEHLPESVMIFGCGYVGRALARYLLERGVRVGALTRNVEKAAALRALGLREVVEARLESHDWHTTLNEDYRAVVNCVSSAGGGLEGYRSSYFEGMQSVLTWAKERAIDRFIYTSSTSVYPQDGGVCVDEDAPTHDAPPTGRILLESEAELAAASAQFKRWYIIRLAGIYGPGRHYLIEQLKEGGGVIPGRGDYSMNMIHLEDIVRAVACGLSSQCNAASGVYNLADDAPATKSQVVRWLATELNLPEPVFKPDALSPRLLRRGGRMPDRKVSNSKFKSAFSWSPVYADFKAGYRALLRADASHIPYPQ